MMLGSAVVRTLGVNRVARTILVKYVDRFIHKILLKRGLQGMCQRGFGVFCGGKVFNV